VKRNIAKRIVQVAAFPPFKKILFRMGRSHGIIFMLHRFDLSPFGISGIKGHDVDFLEQCLIELKASGHSLVSVDEMFQAAKEGRELNNAVAFTIDDGFFDHGVVAEKVFAKLGVPVTIYLVTDFVDGGFWMIESRLEYIIRAAKLEHYELRVSGHTFLGTSQRDLERRLIWHSKALTLANAENFVTQLAETLNVDVPRKAPELFAAITWDEVRRLEKLGISFGAHTTRHPTLVEESDAESAAQIEHSFQRISEELNSPSNIFCYPTGRETDFGVREEKKVLDIGMLGALSTVPGYFQMDVSVNSLSANMFRAPRFSWPDNKIDMAQYVYYIEQIKERVK